MTKTVNMSLSLRTKQYIVAAGVSCSLVVPVFSAIGGATGLPIPVSLGVGVVGSLLVTVLWVRRLGGDEDGATWAGIPRRQYDGRFAEVGGLTRSEQEDALERYSDEG